MTSKIIEKEYEFKHSYFFDYVITGVVSAAVIVGIPATIVIFWSFFL